VEFFRDLGPFQRMSPSDVQYEKLRRKLFEELTDLESMD
jgi:hypothetical protein